MSTCQHVSRCCALESADQPPTVEIITISFLYLAIQFSSSPRMYSVGELEIDEDVSNIFDDIQIFLLGLCIFLM